MNTHTRTHTHPHTHTHTHIHTHTPPPPKLMWCINNLWTLQTVLYLNSSSKPKWHTEWSHLCHMDPMKGGVRCLPWRVFLLASHSLLLTKQNSSCPWMMEMNHQFSLRPHWVVAHLHPCKQYHQGACCSPHQGWSEGCPVMDSWRYQYSHDLQSLLPFHLSPDF